VRFQIGERRYEVNAIEDLSLKMILELEAESRDFGRQLKFADISVWADELNALSEDERVQHPESMWLLAVTIWASRKLAGEPVTFAEAVDFPMSQLVFLPEPQDHKKPANPQKARPTPRGSGRAANQGTEAPSAEKTSELV